MKDKYATTALILCSFGISVVSFAQVSRRMPSGSGPPTASNSTNSSPSNTANDPSEQAVGKLLHNLT